MQHAGSRGHVHQAGIPERGETDEPPDLDDLVPAGEPAQRGHGQGKHQAGEDGVTGHVLHELDLVAHDPPGQQREQEPSQRQYRRKAEVHPRVQRSDLISVLLNISVLRLNSWPIRRSRA